MGGSLADGKRLGDESTYIQCYTLVEEGMEWRAEREEAASCVVVGSTGRGG